MAEVLKDLSVASFIRAQILFFRVLLSRTSPLRKVPPPNNSHWGLDLNI
jgi:hypothetical protein